MTSCAVVILLDEPVLFQAFGWLDTTITRSNERNETSPYVCGGGGGIRNLGGRFGGDTKCFRIFSN